ncbi:MAG: Acyl-CoA thioesterase FadM [Blastococcus sp.]|nr:Acyl-CoA thioesterase FadM [Blastococcus sp.]
MGDVDAAGILYFPVPFRWHEELFTGWLKDVGHPISGMLRDGEACPCVGSAATYPAPAAVDDELEMTLHPTSAGTTSFGLTTRVRRVDNGRLVVHVGSWHVWAAFTGEAPNRTLSPTPLPSWLRIALADAPMTEPPAPGRPSAITTGGQQ